MASRVARTIAPRSSGSRSDKRISIRSVSEQTRNDSPILPHQATSVTLESCGREAAAIQSPLPLGEVAVSAAGEGFAVTLPVVSKPASGIPPSLKMGSTTRHKCPGWSKDPRPNRMNAVTTNRLTARVLFPNSHFRIRPPTPPIPTAPAAPLVKPAVVHGAAELVVVIHARPFNIPLQYSSGSPYFFSSHMLRRSLA